MSESAVGCGLRIAASSAYYLNSVDRPMHKARGDLCVLLLEDDDADAYLTKRELMDMPRVSKIVRARNGQEAISMLESGQLSPDLAFVDLQMPTMDGLEFLSECLTRGLANVPMVVLTSSSARHDAIRSRVRGALQVITKPTDVSELKQVLREAVETFVPSTPAADGDGPVWSLVSQDSLQPSAGRMPSSESSMKTFGRRTSQVRP